jgi:hypothetical protein
MSWTHTTPPSIVPRTAMADKYREVFQILADRETKRARFGRSRSDSIGGPERAINYSVQNSFKYERSNRYSNILSYDKTSVKVRGKGYLNANIVVAKNGHWWVAAQVSRVTLIDGGLSIGAFAGRLPSIYQCFVLWRRFESSRGSERSRKEGP